jgi:hypothetical protein
MLDGRVVESGMPSKRLVRFSREELIRAFKKAFGELHGVWGSKNGGAAPVSESHKQLEPLGRLLVSVSEHPSVDDTFPQTYARVRRYQGRSWDKDRIVRKAARAALVQRGGQSPEDVFSDPAWDHQPGVPVEALERRIRYREPSFYGQLMREYAPSREWYPHTQIETYFDDF